MPDPEKDAEVQKEAALISVPAAGGAPAPESKEPVMPPKPNPEAGGGAAVELSAEDRELKERLELAVERARDEQEGIVAAALELLRRELREATSRCGGGRAGGRARGRAPRRGTAGRAGAWEGAPPRMGCAVRRRGGGCTRAPRWRRAQRE